MEKNRTLVEMARTMLAYNSLLYRCSGQRQSLLQCILWADLLQQLFQGRLLAYFGNKLDISYFWVFSCNGYAHIPKTQSGMMDSKSQRQILVGYNSLLIGYKMYDPITQKVVVSQDVVFDEKSVPRGILPREGQPQEDMHPLMLGDRENSQQSFTSHSQ